jgi:hypothetical protein
VRSKALFRSLRHQFDPLDREILERAFDSAWSAVKDQDLLEDFDSDEDLETVLRSELMEVVSLNGIGDPESLRDALLCRLKPDSSRSDYE